MPNLIAWSPRVLSILRIVTALFFMEHGLMKLFQFPAAQPGAPNPLPAMLMAAAWIEVVGGGLIALGLFTRVGGLHLLRRDGGGLLHGPRAAGL